MKVEDRPLALDGPTEVSLGVKDVRRRRRDHLKESAEIVVPAFVLIAIGLACFAWPDIYPLRNPIASSLVHPDLPPLSPHYLLGTDPLGNDVLSRILYGGRVSLEVGFGATAIGMLVGGLLGIVAGFRGGVADSVIMRILDILLACPALVLAILLSEYLGPSEIHVIWAIAYFSVPAFARLSRAGVLRIREQAFMAAAELSGTSTYGMIRHILPNIFPTIMTVGFLTVGIAVIVEAALSFLGFGVPQPQPTWGNMIAIGQTWLASDPYLVIIPSAFLFTTVGCLNVLSDALRARWALR